MKKVGLWIRFKIIYSGTEPNVEQETVPKLGAEKICFSLETRKKEKPTDLTNGSFLTIKTSISHNMDSLFLNYESVSLKALTCQ